MVVNEQEAGKLVAVREYWNKIVPSALAVTVPDVFLSVSEFLLQAGSENTITAVRAIMLNNDAMRVVVGFIFFRILLVSELWWSCFVPRVMTGVGGGRS